MTMRSLLFLLCCAFALSIQAQEPQIGLYFEEIDIPEPERTNIENDFGFAPRTVRIYLELEENYELQYIYGVGDDLWSLVTQWGCYQHPQGGPTSLSVDSDIIPTFPELAYDSWFTIGAEEFDGNQLFVLPNESIFDAFEAGSDTWVVDGPLGGGIYVTTAFQIPQNSPDENGRILLGQFTIGGELIAPCFNIQVRQLNPDGTIFDPDGPGPLLFQTYQFTSLCEEYFVSPSCLTDFNTSGGVDTADLLLLIGEFGCLADCNLDVSGDDIVAVADLLLLLGEFGSTCSY